MTEHRFARADRNAEPTATPVTNEFDWRAVAKDRLEKLIEVEHDHYVMCDRLTVLQMEHRQLQLASENHRAASQKQLSQLENRLDTLSRHHAAELAIVFGSRSWRLTRPLRTLSVHRHTGRHGAIGVLRGLLRVTVIRHIARVLVRLVPGLHQRVRTALYPDGKKR